LAFLKEEIMPDSGYHQGKDFRLVFDIQLPTGCTERIIHGFVHLPFIPAEGSTFMVTSVHLEPDGATLVLSYQASEPPKT
jgi:hypothetical protein